MKAVNVIIKVVVALAAIAGLVYLAATYGDKIVAWAKKLMNQCCCCCDGDDCCCDGDDCCCECCEEDAELTEEVTEEAAEAAVEAAEQDFEG